MLKTLPDFCKHAKTCKTTIIIITLQQRKQ